MMKGSLDKQLDHKKLTFLTFRSTLRRDEARLEGLSTYSSNQYNIILLSDCIAMAMILLHLQARLFVLLRHSHQQHCEVVLEWILCGNSCPFSSINNW